MLSSQDPKDVESGVNGTAMQVCKESKEAELGASNSNGVSHHGISAVVVLQEKEQPTELWYDSR